MKAKEMEILDIIEVSEHLRLVKFDGVREVSYRWYRNAIILENVMGIGRRAYTKKDVQDMYFWQTEESIVFYIEYLEENDWKTIGDVAFSQHDLPIVIGEEVYRGRGFGQMIIQKLIDLAISLHWEYLEVEEVFSYNHASNHMFERLGFKKKMQRDDGYSYYLDLATKK